MINKADEVANQHKARPYLGGNMDKKDKKPIGVAIIGCSLSF